MTKAEIRDKMKKLRSNLTTEEIDRYSGAIRQRLFETEAFSQCTHLFIYISFRDEVDTKLIIEEALNRKKKVLVPRVEGKVINFYEITGLNSLKASKFGVLEPDESFQNPYKSSKDDKGKKLMILPGLAFDLKGGRIGYGAGYYDRYLSEHLEDNFINIAVAYDFQIFEKLDMEAYDRNADMIITPYESINCHQARME